MPSEERLDQIRDEAWKKGAVDGNGVDIAGGPSPRKPGYYGEPVVRPPVWTWEIPVYLFVGGLSGMAALIAFAALVFNHYDIARSAMWIAGIGATISPVLLVMDLGRPRLFLNMLRIFKPQSPMSVGAWVLFLFGGCAVPGLIALELHFGALAGVLILAAALFGLLLATYTGVLLGATVIPAWFLHRVLLPIHFGTAGF
jgi:formate-dependent nitrite reductase membrane component NrfD